eukprot:gnl/MRDRNA2_/MRDRNA2_18635_c0_seq1.p1 gnl/MRDRNA2_/MRDRNA2_18635_c0~~gnl/MRDRNA2_/MRDRNA2_18635_c0_seq1.p1  ORF type:complete len:694 (+),score=131.08 gnl/MRDRNA2_/MRDRNA2_18635_c0_seq1:93-2084(+)
MTYPLNDWSMSCWVNDFEETVAEGLLPPTYPTMLWDQLQEFQEFYSQQAYYPWTLEISGLNLTDLGGISDKWAARMLSEDLVEINMGMGQQPRRAANEVHVTSKADGVKAIFNFEDPNKFEAGMNILLIWTVILLMLGFTAMLSHSTSKIVLRPLEQLLNQVRNMASTMVKNVTEMAMVIADEDEGNKQNEDDDDEDGNSSAFGAETELLNKVVQKLAVISELTMKKSNIEKEALEMMGEGVAEGSQSNGNEVDPVAMRRSTASNAIVGADITMAQTRQRIEIESLGLSLDDIDSWNFNAMELDEKRTYAACSYFMGPVVPFEVKIGAEGPMHYFLEAANRGYLPKIPYHNWHHAVDVAHTTYRQLVHCEAEQYLGTTERFALLVSAICHDIGHPGLNNPFLVETSHELALRYNDRSPLENMHCAKLFEIMQNPKTAIFSTLDKQQYREARNICIETILHTDMVHHFSLVKEMQMLYEVNSSVLDITRELWLEDPYEFPTKEALECFRESDTRKLVRNLFLHVSDISNPLKPWNICKAWAWQVLEEFFMQGDREKEIGITVQMLNDREKVNRAFSQVGFIEFLVSPLILATVRVFPPLEPCGQEMIQNMQFWKEEWVSNTTPAPTSDEQEAVDARIAKLASKFAPPDQVRADKMRTTYSAVGR